ncbi:MAG: phosphate ABC transporter permease subunit PstC [Lactobacillaceae bacterium]|jgi:phosphate transport system permease protein|nr:phosphate ABC transporter permease subunit PstC [Lactobacillaceae bacterium]
MEQNELFKQLTKKSVASKKDIFGKYLSLSALILIGITVVAILFFVISRGLTTFTLDKINPFRFLFGTDWQPNNVDKNNNPLVGALPMIFGSFVITLLSALVAAPFAIGTAIFMTEVSNQRGAKIMQSVIELLVGIPSVVYGFIGLTVIVPFVRNTFGGSGFGILSGIIVLFVMILPTITSMSIDALNNVPKIYRESAYSIGATPWQTIYKVVLRSAIPGILTAIVFGLSRAFGEALAVQMVVGNSPVIPQNALSPAATLTSVLTQGIGNTTEGSLQNDVLWSLAMILLLMSLVFNLIIRKIGKKGEMKNNV